MHPQMRPGWLAGVHLSLVNDDFNRWERYRADLTTCIREMGDGGASGQSEDEWRVSGGATSVPGVLELACRRLQAIACTYSVEISGRPGTLDIARCVARRWRQSVVSELVCGEALASSPHFHTESWRLDVPPWLAPIKRSE